MTEKSSQNSLSRILDPAIFDDLSPLLVFGFKERAERIRRAADRHRADIDEFFVDGRVGQRVVDRLVQLGDERGWCFRRRQQSVPARRVSVWVALFGECRNVGEGWIALV